MLVDANHNQESYFLGTQGVGGLRCGCYQIDV